MSDIQTIKDKIDIVQLLQEYLPLKKAGANWRANCPFHHEKTPSFMVHKEKQIWHCFGCGKGGDIFTFIQETEGIDFAEALKILAERAGVKLETSHQSEISKSQKNRLLEVNAKAAYFFHNFLMDMPAAKMAREYLVDKRKLQEQTIKDWQIGFIPEQWDLLTQYLIKKGFGIDDLIASGLVIKNAERKSNYDRFRGRIMFPIADVYGNIVGFTGRILVEKENSGGKYVNTPQTMVYDKSRVIYGLNKAKAEIKAKDLAIVVEGQMDVIACHEAGMTNVVAASGTALTEGQIRLLKRYTTNVAMAFDADMAGQTAAKRGIDVALTEGMNIKVIQIPKDKGKDADECLKQNPKVWFDAVENAKGIMDWYFEITLIGSDLTNPKKKQSVAEILLVEINKIPHSVERDEWIKKLADRLGVEEIALRETSAKIKKNNFKGIVIKKPAVETAVEMPTGRLFMDLNKLWALILKFPEIFNTINHELQKEYFLSAPFFELYESCQKQYNSNDKVNPAELPVLKTDKNENWRDILQMQAECDYPDYNRVEAEKEARKILLDIKKNWIKNQREELNQQLKKEQDKDKQNAILKKIMELS
ncbi:MAG: DNA primase [Candidatus Magasanikbacteria bacterium CG10_big_fil_rev_8_21_14_0_10_36_32]|uniref:DNA primase n=1 Tax=Candidatus Magasanikbacteria bacterium CG10_big_fil_rev_8_21_14_0_10_36_32 TaxID=1974646 RepID=A0A2M6W5H7_9BACT|nr:MAG: DNA primase [Candidatus Magasanikbacteria bacterium CG10_big_fil_rev_8_21_14_0_10_36_32]